MSPWGEPRVQDAESRVVGWKAGTALKRADVKQLIYYDEAKKKEYRKLHTVRRKSTEPTPEEADKLHGLPPTWQAIYSTVPHLDPRPVYKKWQKENVKKQAEAEEGIPSTSEKKRSAEEEQLMEDEARDLEQKVRSKKAVLAEKEKLCAEWERKLAKVQKLDKEDDVRSRTIIRRLEKASYAHGVLEGQMRSSDQYFHFLEMDTKADHTKKMATLSRSVALLGTQIDTLKTEVRLLLKEDAESTTPRSLCSDVEAWWRSSAGRLTRRLCRA